MCSYERLNLCCRPNDCLTSGRNKELQLIYKFLSYPPYMACRDKRKKGHSEICRHKIELFVERNKNGQQKFGGNRVKLFWRADYHTPASALEMCNDEFSLKHALPSIFKDLTRVTVGKRGDRGVGSGAKNDHFFRILDLELFRVRLLAEAHVEII